jgi:hypothetical protein
MHSKSPGAPCVTTADRDRRRAQKVRDGRLLDEGTLRYALAGIEDLLDEIRAGRFFRSAA